MFNMIKLDWLGMKYYQKRILLVPLIICIYGLLNEALVIPLIAFLMLAFSVNPFVVEEKGKLDNLYLTLPVTRKAIVNARFGLSIIMQLAGVVIGTAATILLSAMLNGRTVFYLHTFKADFTTVFLLICSSMLFNAIINLSMFPILFKIGYAKGKALGFYLPVATVSISAGIIYILWQINSSFREYIFSLFKWAFANTIWTAAIMLSVAAFVLAVSYILSHKTYANRDF